MSKWDGIQTRTMGYDDILYDLGQVIQREAIADRDAHYDAIEALKVENSRLRAVMDAARVVMDDGPFYYNRMGDPECLYCDQLSDEGHTKGCHYVALQQAIKEAQQATPRDGGE